MAVTVQVAIDSRSARSALGYSPAETAIEKALPRIRARLARRVPAVHWTASKFDGIRGASAGDAAAELELPTLAWQVRDTVAAGLGDELAALVPVRVHVTRNPDTGQNGRPRTYGSDVPVADTTAPVRERYILG